MVVGARLQVGKSYLENQEISLGNYLGASFQLAQDDGATPVTMAAGQIFLDEQLNDGSDTYFSLEETQQRLTSAGVSYKPKTGLRKETIDMIIKRDDRRKKRDFIFNNYKGGVASEVLAFGAGVAASAIDPLNVLAGLGAAATLPISGATAAGGLLGKAALSATATRATVGGTIAARAGGRATLGAAEGVLGAALVEPLVIGGKSKLQEDYTLYESFANIVFGGVAGGGLHVLGGSAADWVKGTKAPKPVTQMTGQDTVSPISKVISEFRPQERVDLVRAGLSMAMEGRRVDLDPLVNYYAAKALKRADLPSVQAYLAETVPDARVSVDKITRVPVLDDNGQTITYATIDEATAAIQQADLFGQAEPIKTDGGYVLAKQTDFEVLKNSQGERYAFESKAAAERVKSQFTPSERKAIKTLSVNGKTYLIRGAKAADIRALQALDNIDTLLQQQGRGFGDALETTLKSPYEITSQATYGLDMMKNKLKTHYSAAPTFMDDVMYVANDVGANKRDIQARTDLDEEIAVLEEDLQDLQARLGLDEEIEGLEQITQWEKEAPKVVKILQSYAQCNITRGL